MLASNGNASAVYVAAASGDSDALPKDRARTRYKVPVLTPLAGCGAECAGKGLRDFGQHALVRRQTARLSADARAGFLQVACQT